MKTFTIKHDGKKHRAALTTLCPEDRYGEDKDFRYKVHCGTYDRQDRWTGISIDGVVPIPEMIRWAYRKGYLKFIDREGR